MCGDLNVAHNPIDIERPKQNERNAGFTIEERNSFSKLLDTGLVDSFRSLHPSLRKYTFWSYSKNARMLNVGWRLDYFLVNNINKVSNTTILDEYHGSDHCPIKLELNK